MHKNTSHSQIPGIDWYFYFNRHYQSLSEYNPISECQCHNEGFLRGMLKCLRFSLMVLLLPGLPIPYSNRTDVSKTMKYLIMEGITC